APDDASVGPGRRAHCVTSCLALATLTVRSASPWNTMSGTGREPTGAPRHSTSGVPTCIAIQADSSPPPALYGRPEWTPTAAYSSGEVVRSTTATAPPAHRPATDTRYATQAYACMP